ncbi:MAG: hypothetical protein MUF17_03435, partial [Syntrophales bacterium]|nr:hypothetical protein [Syntrophales bacterium]
MHDGAIHIPLRQVNARNGVVRIGERRVEFQGLQEGRQSLVTPALSGKHNAPVEMGPGEVRLDGERLLDVGRGFVDPAIHDEGDGEV